MIKRYDIRPRRKRQPGNGHESGDNGGEARRTGSLSTPLAPAGALEEK
jgi:hypothetical protein